MTVRGVVWNASMRAWPVLNLWQQIVNSQLGTAIYVLKYVNGAQRNAKIIIMTIANDVRKVAENVLMSVEKLLPRQRLVCFPLYITSNTWLLIFIYRSAF